MKFLIVGCGSIGERHLTNLQKTIPDCDVSIYDPDPTRIKFITNKYQNIQSVKYDTIDSEIYDCVFICTPPISHVKLALRAAKSGSNVFIEKPLSSRADEIKDIEILQQLAHDKKLLTFVGYNFRFNKALNKIKQIIESGKHGRILHFSTYFGQFLPDWRPNVDYAKNYTARKNLGGGIIHDGSHELDYMKWLLGIPTTIQSQLAVTNIIDADTEAVADILMTFKNNILGYIHLDFLRREYKRKCEIILEKGIVEWNFPELYINIYDSMSKSWESIHIEEEINDMYKYEINHVVDCIKERKSSSIIDLGNGISTFILSCYIYESAISGNRIDVTKQSNPHLQSDLFL
jgi:predicted dehydrogenase